MIEQDALEQMRWNVEQLGFRTPEEFEAARGESWFATGRNHTTWMHGEHACIQREVRDDGDDIEVTDRNSVLLSAVVIGRRIVAIVREPHSGQDWGSRENSVTITLDDGSQLHFDGWGYDASGLTTSYRPTKDAA